MRISLLAIVMLVISNLAAAQGPLPANQTPSAERAKAAKAAWTPKIRQALGFEDASLWRKGETVASPKKEGQAALKWANHTKNTGLTFSQSMDLSAFNEMSFWLYSEKETEETFLICLPSVHTKGVNSYYSKMITVDWKGWKKVELRFRDFGRARNPAGWHKIGNITFTATGWNQDPTDEPVWILDGMDFSYNDKPYVPKIDFKIYAEPPTKETFLKNLRPGHPRLVLLDEDLPRLKKFVTEDPTGKAWFAKVKTTAEMYYRKDVQTHRLPDGRRLLSISRDVVNRMYHWGLMYRLEGDRKWLDRAVKEMEAVVKFKDWNPSHWLDTGEMIHAIGIGYDWFYNGLTEAQRKTIREGLWDKGLRLAYASHMGLPCEGGQGWRRVTNNWNFVCNGGSSIGAMAVLDEMAEKMSAYLASTYYHIQIPIEHFEPDGAWWEGLGYWGYSMRYFLPYLRCLETAFGTDFGFVKALQGTGFSMAGDFPVYLVSPVNGFFNFADSGSGGTGYSHFGLFYLASHFNNPLYLHFQEKSTLGGLEDLLYYEPFKADLKPQDVALDKHFRKTEVATMRSSWTDDNALFVGIKAGRNGIAHYHQDLGSFAFYGLGEKWVKDMGTEGQTYQSHRHHIPRHHFYRIREEGHNTLVFDPTDQYCQGTKASSEIVRFETSPGDAFGVVDLTNAYKKYVTSAKRGYRLLGNRRAFLVQDEIKGKKPHEIWWFAHGDAGQVYEVAEDKRSVTIVKGQKVCRAYLLSPPGAALEVMDARPLPKTPDPQIQAQNIGIKKLAVHLKDTQDVTISVLFVPYFAYENEPEVSKTVAPLDAWKATTVKGPELSEILVDGKPLEGFTPAVLDYSVSLKKGEAIPAVAARPKVKIEAAKEFPGTTRITVGGKTEYKVRFVPERVISRSKPPAINPKPIKVNDVTVTASQHDGNPQSNVLDGDLTTRWSASGKHEWIAFEFAAPRDLSSVQIAWFSGNTRQAIFKISVSDDGKTWREVFDGRSSGKTVKLEKHTLKSPVKTRYVRIDSFGNTDNEWNSVTEVVF